MPTAKKEDYRASDRKRRAQNTDELSGGGSFLQVNSEHQGVSPNSPI